MKLIPLLLLVGMFAVSGWAQEAKPEPLCTDVSIWAEDYKPEPYSAELVKRAESGGEKAQCDLGYSYLNGTGVAKDEKEAVKWCTKSVKKGNAKAQCFLGTCYHLGIGVTKNEKEAVKWWTKSAKQGFEPAKKTLEYLKSK